MKISYNWLKQYANFNLSPKDLGDVLTGSGLEVEDITPFESIAGGLQGVVTGAEVFFYPPLAEVVVFLKSRKRIGFSVRKMQKAVCVFQTAVFFG